MKRRLSLRLLFIAVLAVVTLALVGWLYFYDQGDPEIDTTMMQKRAEAGHMNSRFALGEAYRLGRGKEKDMVQAYRWHMKAALQGHVGSQYTLGLILEGGEGVRQNLAKAFEWYSLAAKMGDLVEAEFAMGLMYFHGRGVTQDYAEAFDLFEKTARKGHLVAQYLLGAMYEEGWVNGRDFVEAYKWYTLALPGRDAAIALNPLYDPRRALDRLIPRMTKFQIRRAKQAIKDWRFDNEDPFDN
ncbi:MAG TPA: sel1 repeat family protein [Rhodospirillales bacterium]|nr:sel1 repeat family protein [Rhodospirillales bacterium]